jgi:hypothetical protein
MDHHSSTLLGVGVGLGLVLTLGGVLATPAAAAPQDKVTICHATSSVTDPYQQITVNENSIVKPNGTPKGHGAHTGPVYPEPGWGDIIPSFPYTNDHGGTSIYPGLHWDSDGQAVWNGGCLVVPTEPPPEPITTTTEPEVTTTTSGSGSTTTTTNAGSTTTQPGGSTTTTSGSTTTTTTSGSATTTTEAGSGSTTTTSGSTTTSSTTHPGASTTTSLPPTTTPTTAPPSELPPPITDPGDGVETMPATGAVVVDPGPVVVNLGMLSDSQRVTLEAEVDTSAPPTTTTSQPPAPLAGTGLNATAMVLAALSLILAGALLFIGSRRPAQRGTK